jgi:diamine N-acetyltransferase
MELSLGCGAIIISANSLLLQGKNMDADLLTRLETAELSNELKTAVANFYTALEDALPKLPRRREWQLAMYSERILDEITDDENDVYWWELTLDLAIRWTAEAEGPSGPAAQAAIVLRDLLRETIDSDEDINLVEINEDTVRGICLMSETLDEPQRGMVADNAISLAQAHFSPNAWFRAIYAGRTPVGFLMLSDDDQAPEYFLWRMMIAGPYQRRGYGREALDRLVDYVRTRPGAEELTVSCGQGPGSPEEFYTKYGFEPTGEIAGDEVVLKLVL